MKGFILVLVFLMISTNLAYSRYHRYRYYGYSYSEQSSSKDSTLLATPFCDIVNSAFRSLDIKNLDEFVRSIPLNKRKAALACIQTMKRNKVIQELENF
jgi:hypothetical protein